MTREDKERMSALAESFRLPRYKELPTVGLYLEQTGKYVSELLEPLQADRLTGSMISNYVKKRLIASPVKKQYGREQIAYLLFIAVAKNILSIDALERFIKIQMRSYPLELAYDYFCAELENILAVVFGLKAEPEPVGTTNTDEKLLLRSTIIAFCHKIYLEKCLELEEQSQL